MSKISYGRFNPAMVSFVGVVIASCGSVERCLFNGLIEFRNRHGQKVDRIPRDVGRKIERWELCAAATFEEASPQRKEADALVERTSRLFNFRDILVHSLWLGQDENKALHVQQVLESKGKGKGKGKLLHRPVVIHLQTLAGYAKDSTNLFGEHNRFLLRTIMGLKVDARGKIIRPPELA